MSMVCARLELGAKNKLPWQTCDEPAINLIVRMPLSCKICGNKAILKRPKTVRKNDFVNPTMFRNFRMCHQPAGFRDESCQT